MTVTVFYTSYAFYAWWFHLMYRLMNFLNSVTFRSIKEVTVTVTVMSVKVFSS